MSGTMDKIKAKVENVLHKDKDTTHTSTAGTHTGTTGTHTTGTHTHGSDPTGPHNAHLANQADPRVDSDRVGGYGNTSSAGGASTGHGLTGTSGTTGTHTGTRGSDPTGPHDSHLANKLDPRVDSDQIGGRGNTAGAGGPAHGSGLTGAGHSTHTGAGIGSTGNGLSAAGYGSDPTGPHDSRLGNKADPRVDSDRYGAAGNTTGLGHSSHTTGAGVGSTGLGHSSHTAGTGIGSTGHSTGHGYGSDPTGPHDSRLGNKADPRVDSDRYGTAGNTTGTGATGTGLTGTGHSHGGYASANDPTGPHQSHLGNQADPRVDSDRYGGAGNTAGAGGYGHTGTTGATVAHGSSSTTAGPHNSNLLNKLDPRVDSDLDGSKTVGGNKTSGY